MRYNATNAASTSNFEGSLCITTFDMIIGAGFYKSESFNDLTLPNLEDAKITETIAFTNESNSRFKQKVQENKPV